MKLKDKEVIVFLKENYSKSIKEIEIYEKNLDINYFINEVIFKYKIYELLELEEIEKEKDIYINNLIEQLIQELSLKKVNKNNIFMLINFIPKNLIEEDIKNLILKKLKRNKEYNYVLDMYFNKRSTLLKLWNPKINLEEDESKNIDIK
jgi:hypothetical protein